MSESLKLAEDHPREACGVFGIYAPGQPVAELTYLGLLRLQHRGQEGAGIYVAGSDGELYGVANLGLANVALAEGAAVRGLPVAEIATGHVRYGTHLADGTSQDREFRALQPMIGSSNNGEVKFTVSHNGHIANFDELSPFSNGNKPITDSELIVKLIQKELNQGSDDVELREAVANATNHLIGAFSLVIMGHDKLIGLRDPKGFRPLWLGELAGGGWVLASETGALKTVGAEPKREIEAGELIEIDAAGAHSYRPFPKPEVEQKLCAFEFIYQSAPDNKLLGESVERTRLRSGQLLARRFPVDADIVVGSPESGTSAANGYARESGLPLARGLVKNQYVGRLFISPGQNEREKKVQIKFNADEAIVEAQRVILVDDSIIRGDTTRGIVGMLREAGATEVHVRIASDLYKNPCFYGMDTGRVEELIAADKSKDEICEIIGADSLEYLSVIDVEKAAGKAVGKLCLACMTGEYPTRLPSSSL